MEEFGDWIYIIVIIIAGVGSFISSIRKKTRQEAELNQPRNIITDDSDSDEDDFWHDIIPQAENKPVIKIQPQKQALPSYSPVDRKNKPFLSIHQEGQSNFFSDEKGLIETPEEYAAITIEDIPRDAQEWRKVFIYNEIFTRKH